MANLRFRKFLLVVLALVPIVPAGTTIQPTVRVEATYYTPMVAAGQSHTVGLKSNGTVIAIGLNDDNQCDVSTWTDIKQVSAGAEHTTGLKADDNVIAADQG